MRTPYSRGPAGDDCGLNVAHLGRSETPAIPFTFPTTSEAEAYYERQRLRRLGHWLAEALKDRQRRNRQPKRER
jgi:hypothetical protein